MEKILKNKNKSLKLSKLGFTVVELIVSFTLAMVISVFLFQIVVSLKNLYTKSITKTELINIQSLVTKQMNENFKKGIVSLSDCGDNCVEFLYSDNTSDKLVVSNNSLEFGNYKTNLPGDSYIRNQNINIASFATFSENTNNSILIVNIPIYNDNLGDDSFEIKVLYPFNSNTNNLTAIDFTN